MSWKHPYLSRLYFSEKAHKQIDHSAQQGNKPTNNIDILPPSQTLNPLSPADQATSRRSPKPPTPPSPDPVARRRPCSVLAAARSGARTHAQSPRLSDCDTPLPVPTQLASANRRGSPSAVATVPIEVTVGRRPKSSSSRHGCRPFPQRCHRAMELEGEAEVVVPVTVVLLSMVRTGPKSDNRLIAIIFPSSPCYRFWIINCNID